MLHVATRVTAAARRHSTGEHSDDGRLDLCLRSAVVAVWCAMLVASASAFAAPQPRVATYVLDKKGFWRPMVKDAMPEASRQLTPAEIRLIHERLARISGLLYRVKVLNPRWGWKSGLERS